MKPLKVMRQMRSMKPSLWEGICSGPKECRRVPSGTSELVQQKKLGAEEGTRTPTPLRVHGPEPCASANSATTARCHLLRHRWPEHANRESLVLQTEERLSMR